MLCNIEDLERQLVEEAAPYRAKGRSDDEISAAIALLLMQCQATYHHSQTNKKISAPGNIQTIGKPRIHGNEEILAAEALLLLYHNSRSRRNSSQVNCLNISPIKHPDLNKIGNQSLFQSNVDICGEFRLDSNLQTIGESKSKEINESSPQSNFQSIGKFNDVANLQSIQCKSGANSLSSNVIGPQSNLQSSSAHNIRNILQNISELNAENKFLCINQLSPQNIGELNAEGNLQSVNKSSNTVSDQYNDCDIENINPQDVQATSHKFHFLMRIMENININNRNVANHLVEEQNKELKHILLGEHCKMIQ